MKRTRKRCVVATVWEWSVPGQIKVRIALHNLEADLFSGQRPPFKAPTQFQGIGRPNGDFILQDIPTVAHHLDPTPMAERSRGQTPGIQSDKIRLPHPHQEMAKDQGE